MKNSSKHCKFYKRHTLQKLKIIEESMYINYLKKRSTKIYDEKIPGSHNSTTEQGTQICKETADSSKVENK